MAEVPPTLSEHINTDHRLTARGEGRRRVGSEGKGSHGVKGAGEETRGLESV